jgi:CheY-like chemotaxis protein
MGTAMKSILVVEDDDLNAKLLRVVLEGSGFAVSLEQKGGQVIQRAISAPPDLFLIDLLLPDISGFSVIRQIRARAEFASTPVITVTVLSAPEVERDALSLGANLFLRKPVSINLLLTSIKEQLAKASMS